ncbi:PAS domain S-box protein [Thalassobaculum sp.]|uniref:PAS domain S-box protein n=1 Tax=Thalassobaculum sp. TaxID=2022740 RepID=UPI0032EABC75
MHEHPEANQTDGVAKDLEHREQEPRVSHRIARMGSFHVDLDTGIQRWSPELYDVMEMDPCEDPTGTVERVAQPDDYQDYLRLRAHAITTGETISGTMAVRTGSSGLRRMRYFVEPKRGPDGRVSGLSGFIQDVTEFETLSLELKRSRDQLIKAEKVGSFGNWVSDKTGANIVLSPGAAKVLDLPEGEPLAPGALTSRFAPSDVDDYLRRRQVMIESATPLDYECDARLPGGTVKRVRIRSHPEYDSAGDFTGAMAILQDVTAAHLDRQEAENARARLERAEAVGHFGHWFGNFEDRTAILSKGAARILGLPAGEVLQRNRWQSGLSANGVNRFEAFRARTLETGTPFREDFSWRMADGTTKHLMIELHKEQDAQTGHRAGFAIIRDVTEEYEAKQALEESRAMLREASYVARIGYFRTFLLERRTVWSPELAGILGSRPGVRSTDDIAGYFDPLDFAEYQKRCASTELDAATFTGRMRFSERTADGRARWLGYRVVYKTDTDGRAVERFGVLQDITEQVHLEEERAQAASFLRNVLENAGAGVAVATRDRRFAVANRIYREQIGIHHGSILGEPVDQVIATTGRSALARDMKHNDERIMSTGETLRFEIREPTPHGDLRDMQIVKFPILDEVGGVIAVGTIRTDVTELKDTQRQLQAVNQNLEQTVAERTAALRLSEERYRTIAEIASDWFFEVDGNLTLLSVSNGFERSMGRRPSMMLGRSFLELAPQPDVVGPGAANTWQVLVDCTASRKPVRDLEVWCRGQDSHRCLRINAAPLFEGGVFIGYRGAASDISSLQSARRQLAEAEHMASLGRLVAGVAHELNTPLGAARTVASSLVSRLTDLQSAVTAWPTSSDSMIRQIQNLEQGLQLVNEGLVRSADLVSRFKQVAVDQTSGTRRAFGLREVVENNIASILPSFPGRKVVIDLEIADDLRIESYPGPFGQVVTNIVQNAFVHAFDGRADGRLQVQARWTGSAQSAVDLVFHDDGNGMAQSTVRRIFDPFFTTKLGDGGSGLGMHIVYNIVAQVLGGRIEARSPPGGGAEFHLILPAKAPTFNEASATKGIG